MKETTKILMDEHENILRLADALEKECNALKNGKDVDNKFFMDAVDFIRNYADKFHHAKEEDILFKEMCSNENQKKLHCNPVEQMLYEHNLGRDFVKGLEQGINENDKRKIIENAQGYAQLIREHIFKEDNILYPMADEVLNEKIQKSMLIRFKEAERQRAKDKKRCLGFLDNL